MPTSDLLAAVGEAIVALDPRYIALGAFLTALVFTCVLWKRGDLSSSQVMTSIPPLVLAVFSIVSGTKLLAVFTLTSPPALELIGTKELIVVGLSSGLISLIAGVLALKKLFSPTRLGVHLRTPKSPGQLFMRVELSAELVGIVRGKDGRVGTLHYPSAVRAMNGKPIFARAGVYIDDTSADEELGSVEEDKTQEQASGEQASK